MPVETQEEASPVDPQVDVDPNAPPPEVAASDGAPRGWEAMSTWLGSQETSDADIASHLADISEASFKELDDRQRLMLTALHRKHEADRKADTEARTKADTERAEKAKAQADAVAARERELSRREAALLAAASAAKDPGKEPELDPFTPEGQKALAKYAAERAVFEAHAPARDAANERIRVERWNAIVDEHTGLRDAKTLDEFNAFMTEKNKGVRAGQRPRLTAEDGARQFFNERELNALRADRQKAQAATDRERAKAATHIGQSSGASTPDYVAIYQALRKQDEDKAEEYLESNPAAKQAYIRRFAPQHAN